MSTFRLEPENILGLAADRLDVESSYFLKARSYVQDHVSSYSTPMMPALVNQVMWRHEEYANGLVQNMKAGAHLLSTVSRKLAKHDRDYAATNADSALRFNDLNTLGAGYSQGPGLGRPGETVRFPNAVPPLREPAPMEVPADIVMGIVTLMGDAYSPSFWVFKTIEQIIGVNIAQVASEWIAGDYRGLSVVGDAIVALSEFCAEASSNIEADVEALFSGWAGVAASDAEPYFRELLHLFAAQAEPMRELGDLYQQLASAAWEGAVAIGQVIGMIADLVIGKLIEWAATRATSEHPVPEIMVAALFEAWLQALTIHAAVIASCFGLISAISAADVALTHVSLETFKEG